MSACTSFDALHAPLLIDSYPLERKVLESPLAARDARRARAGSASSASASSPARCASRSASRRSCDPRTTAARRSRSRAHRSPSRRCARSARALRRSRPAATSGPTTAVEQQVGAIAGNEYDKLATRLDRQREPVAAPGRAVRRQRGVRRAQRPPARRLAGRRARRAPATASAQEQADDEEGAAILCRRGAKFLTAGDADLVALRRAVQPVYEWLERDTQTKAAIGEILAMRSRPRTPGRSRLLRARAGAGRVHSGPRRSTASTARTSRSSNSAARRATTRARATRATSGTSAWSCTTVTLHASPARPTASTRRATSRCDGDVLTFLGRNEARPDFSYKWNLYRGVLTLRKTGEGPTSSRCIRLAEQRRRAVRLSRGRDLGDEPGPGAARAVDGERSAERLDPVGEPA